MSPVTPETLPRHELVGLSVSVTDADNADLVGIEGEGVTETTKTLGIERDRRAGASARHEAGGSDETGSTRVSHVPKAGTTFEFDLGEALGASGTRVVAVEGRRLVARSARRTENTGDSKWR